MNFKINNTSTSVELSVHADRLVDEFLKRGYYQAVPDQHPDFVLNLIDLDKPVAYRRKVQEEMVVSVAFLDKDRPDLKSACYIALVKSISNMLFCLVAHEGSMKGYSITPEVGFVEFPFTSEKMYQYMYPVISSHFVLRNRFDTCLASEKLQSVPEVNDIVQFAKELLSLGVLPAPFPLTSFLDQDMIEHLFRLYNIRGLSYGNLSIRNKNYDIDGSTFWMTARGVDKSKLTGVGKDILLVKGYDEASGEMVVSVPEDYDPKVRVSVDAIEHYMIYHSFPQVGAIVHVHAWIDGISCTDQTYPCGTRELAENVVALLKSTPDPGRAEAGLKNHGITVTGPDIRDIFSRLRTRLKTTVPMFN
ncbi:MAG: class II aldolase/adducin family protein [Bacteroidota bacterium]|nr:class II aldolase/adducin family protein [Bacteroidota bacterium]